MHEILHACLHGGDYSSIVDGPKQSGRKAFQSLAIRCAGIQDNGSIEIERWRCHRDYIIKMNT